MEDPFVGVPPDGSPTGFHPGGHGTFAKIITNNMVDLQSLSEAVRKMTSVAAGSIGIKNRKATAVRMAADIIVFDPESLRTNATYPEPY